MRNSNLLPVNAKGEVLFLSVVSMGKSGRESTPSFKTRFALAAGFTPLSIASMISPSSSPVKTEMMAGGASLPPRRQSLPALETDTRSRS